MITLSKITYFFAKILNNYPLFLIYFSINHLHGIIISNATFICWLSVFSTRIQNHSLKTGALSALWTFLFSESQKWLMNNRGSKNTYWRNKWKKHLRERKIFLLTLYDIKICLYFVLSQFKIGDYPSENTPTIWKQSMLKKRAKPDVQLNNITENLQGEKI